MDFIAWHGCTKAEHQALYGQWWAEGFRTISLCLYGTPADPRYAAVMVKRPDVIDERHFPALDAAQYQHTFDVHEALGYGLVIVSANGPANAPTFAAVFQPMDPIPLTQHDLDGKTLRTLNEQAWDNGTSLQWLDAYGDPNDPSYVAIWTPNPDLVAWNCDTYDAAQRLDADASAMQAQFDAAVSGGARLRHVAVTPGGRYVPIFDDSVTTGWVAQHGLSAADYQKAFDDLTAQGFAPVQVSAKGPAESATFAAIFRYDESVLPRSFSTTGNAAIPEIDACVENIMRANALRGASLAITKGTKLVYAKGYTYAEPGYPAVQPTTFFRQASVSKTFAALAAHDLIAENKATLDTRVQDVLHLTSPGGSAPSDERFGDITIRHLLEMTSGVESGLIAEDVAVAKDAHVSLPVDSRRLAAYAASRTLTIKPGDPPDGYNNGGYFLLGLVVAALRQKATFAEALQPTLDKLQISRVRSARSLVTAQAADEARYQPNSEAFSPKHFLRFTLARSVMSHAQPVVPLGYGEWNLENCGGAGGLSAAATDVARMIAAFSLHQGDPVLLQAIAAMLAGAADASSKYGTVQSHGYHGLDRCTLDDQAKLVYEGFKGGDLSTSQNMIYFMRDGFGYVLCFDRTVPKNVAAWFPKYDALLQAAAKQAWGETDLFPLYGMPSFNTLALIAFPWPFKFLALQATAARIGGFVRTVVRQFSRRR